MVEVHCQWKLATPHHWVSVSATEFFPLRYCTDHLEYQAEVSNEFAMIKRNMVPLDVMLSHFHVPSYLNIAPASSRIDFVIIFGRWSIAIYKEELIYEAEDLMKL